MPTLPHRLAASAALAGQAAGVLVRDLERGEMAAASALLGEVWRTGPRESPMEPGLLVALVYTGNYVSGAFDPGGRLVGACAGFLGRPFGAVLHSHVAAVLPGSPRGVGTALKLHQRAWCAEHRVGTVAWTYDPLIARNAWFNLGRLGAHVEDYLVDLYGPMHDGLNAGEASDRLLVHWPVDPDLAAPPTGGVTGAHAALEASPHGPVAHPDVPVDAAAVTLAVPPDVEGLRGADRAVAARWRTVFRDAYADVHEQGWRVRGFVRSDPAHPDRYVLERPA